MITITGKTYYSQAEACGMMGVSMSALRLRAWRRGIRSCVISGRAYYSEAQLQEMSAKRHKVR